MTLPPFQTFGPDHRLVLLLTLGAAVAIGLGARKIRSVPDDRTFRGTAAAVLAASGFASWTMLGMTDIKMVPLHLCDFALVCVVFALIRPARRLAGELAYFWGMGGSLQAVLTPDLSYGFPNPSFILFFLVHCGVVLGAWYLAVRGQLMLTPVSVWRAWLATNIYVVIAGLVNWRFGTNFGFLAHKPAQPSLLDYLGPWPYYILACEAVGLALFFLLYALAFVVDQYASGRGRPKDDL